ncbi:MAG: hypothetical protein COX57_06000 [Alphaproteobacteria bacterium CG_4_10_14_0_2_um_filter_63_37]|nr:MAG: hypothetical protein AUJ55_01480 [Proteobacteria bacterium CG1_02_64_396]PJA24867.1 MAG: hypothetical protein COX57_06000 [Alphaproteobacteria bacterium CG_4_10_14_0_2_um_filter_63_37]
MSRGLALAVCLAATPVWGDALWHDGDATLYGYGQSLGVRSDSPLNPGNQFAQIPATTWTGEARLNLGAGVGDWSLHLRPIARIDHRSAGDLIRREGYLSQAELRWQISDAVGISGGRDLLTWGPAQFRSPSNPFYFDAGRSDPMRELSGLDDVKATWSPDFRAQVLLARIVGSGHFEPIDRQNSWLLKGEYRADDWTVGWVAARRDRHPAFWGGYGQITVSDAVLLYAEFGSGARQQALQSPDNPLLPFSVATDAPRRSDWLIGGSYSFLSGETLTLEWLHQGSGFSASAYRAFFARLHNQNPSAPLALAHLPGLLGRDYLHLVAQSAPGDDDLYWRAMGSVDATHGGGAATLYLDENLDGRWGVFGLGQLPLGGGDSEFKLLYDRLLLAGMKLAL